MTRHRGPRLCSSEARSRSPALDPGAGIAGGAVTGGCGCATTGAASMPFALALLALGAWIHRRRR